MQRNVRAVLPGEYVYREGHGTVHKVSHITIAGSNTVEICVNDKHHLNWPQECGIIRCKWDSMIEVVPPKPVVSTTWDEESQTWTVLVSEGK